MRRPVLRSERGKRRNCFDLRRSPHGFGKGEGRTVGVARRESTLPEEEHLQHAVILPSLFWNRTRADFYAVTSGFSADGIGFRSATVPAAAERLTCNIRHVGSLEVRIVRTGTNAFTVRPTGGRRRNAALARTLVALARSQDERAERPRMHPRIVPLQTDLRVALDDGSVLSGRLVDVSASGAAVRLDVPIAAGARIRLGSTEAVVIRTYDNGIGASFLTPFDPGAVDEHLVL